jgi:predicted NACHT family NTPase
MDALRAFSRQYLDIQCLITCRIAATEYQFERFTYVEVADFTDEQVEAYARKWFTDDPDKGERFLVEIARTEHERLRELSRTPLLLSMLCLAFGAAGRFPQRRAEIYGEALDALLKRWDSARRIERDKVYHRLSLRRKRQVLAQISAATFERGAFFLPKLKLERQIADCVRSVVPVDRGLSADREDEIDGEAVIKAIEAQHGILVERAHGIYAFAHPMFQEYFAAVYLAEPTNQEKLGQVLEGHIADDRWREVFLLTASMLDNADRLFAQFAAALEKMVREEEAIVGLLIWAEEQAARAGGGID